MHDKIMTAARYKKVIKSLGLSQRKAAKFIGVNERTSRRYASGEWPVPRATAMLLAVMEHRGIKPQRVEAML